MDNEARDALIDANFFIKICEVNKPIELLDTIAEMYSYNLESHECIIDHEIVRRRDIEIMSNAMETGTIDRLTYEEICGDDFSQRLYIEYFNEYFNYLNEKNINNGKTGVARFKTIDEIKGFWKSGYNMGEIHSCLAAYFLQIPLFLSNDSDANILARNKLANLKYHLEVKALFEMMVTDSDMWREKVDSESRKKMIESGCTKEFLRENKSKIRKLKR